MFNAVKLCQVQYYSLLEAFIKAIKASVTFHGEGNVLLIAFQRGLLFVWNLAIGRWAAPDLVEGAHRVVITQLSA